MKKSPLEQYQMVHFATHGLVDNQNPQFSGLVLSKFDTPIQAFEDYFFSLNDIFNLKLAAKLVVLSACETGQGQNTQGEGIVGLTRGFMFAGAERIVSYGWQTSPNEVQEDWALLRLDKPHPFLLK